MRIDTSAGCCVIRKQNNKTELLIIYRKWPDGREAYALPKGHREDNEELMKTAIRETREETGYKNIKLGKYIGLVNYILDMDDGIDKTDHFYLATLENEEKIDQVLTDWEKNTGMEVQWIEIEDAPEKLTWPNEKEIAQKVIETI